MTKQRISGFALELPFRFERPTDQLPCSRLLLTNPQLNSYAISILSRQPQSVGQLHTRMTLLPLTPTAQHPAWLDPKEAAYLNWISVGKTMEEAADLEGVKYNSVKSKLEEARKRFQIHTMPHLVALAIRAGLI